MKGEIERSFEQVFKRLDALESHCFPERVFFYDGELEVLMALRQQIVTEAGHFYPPQSVKTLDKVCAWIKANR